MCVSLSFVNCICLLLLWCCVFAFLVLTVVRHCFVCVSGCLFAAIVLFAVCFGVLSCLVYGLVVLCCVVFIVACLFVCLLFCDYRVVFCSCFHAGVLLLCMLQCLCLPIRIMLYDRALC